MLNEFPETPNNTFWQLYSANPRKIQIARLNYQHKLTELGSIINQLFEFYKMEGVIVSYTVEDYVKDYVKDHLDLLSPEDIFKKFSSEEILEKFSTQERLIGLSAQERLTGLSSKDILKNFSSEEFLKNIPPEELEQYLAKIKKH